MKRVITLGFTIIFVSVINFTFAQTVEQLPKTQEEIEKERLLRERIEKEAPKPEIQEEAPAPMPAPAVGEQKVLIKTITVVGATLLTDKEIKEIISPYENQELSLSQMQKIADLITDAYRKKGFITSRAYLPPQKIEADTLEIRILEGTTGDIEVKGNKYFKSGLYRDKIDLEKGEPFNYEEVRKGLSRINELPDRNAKAVITPGKEPGTTDVVLEAKDRLPIHIGFDWDNYASRYVDQDRFRTTLTHNNLLGFDDVFSLQYQLAEGENYRLLIARYLFPLIGDMKLGMFVADSKIDLKHEYEDDNARGKSRLYSFYINQPLIDRENLSIDINAGFDYKDTFNFSGGDETSRDRLRILKASLDFDFTDNYGRTILNNEISYGLSGTMGALEKVDERASRDGAGGKFVKDTLGFLRLQKLPFGTTLLWKNQFQFSPYILTSSEQFQTGGIVNVRGYPNAEAVGDKGYSMTWELSMPVYFIPRDFKVPFSQAKLYNALRLVTFYDWANTRLYRPTSSEEESKTLRGAGFGFRLYLPENFSVRVELAWPLDSTPSDRNHQRTWTEISKSF